MYLRHIHIYDLRKTFSAFMCNVMGTIRDELSTLQYRIGNKSIFIHKGIPVIAHVDYT